MFNKKLKDQVSSLQGEIVKLKDEISGFGGLTGGGFQNYATGAGTNIDKTEYSFFTPTRLSNKNELETLYVQSWAAGKFIDIPIDDMFIRWREFEDMENSDIEKIQKAELEFDIIEKLSCAMKAGNLYGTGLMILITKEAPMDTPLNVNRLQIGDLQNIIVVDRFDATVKNKKYDPLSKRFGLPEMYRINLRRGGNIDVHASRILRFDGKKSLSQNNWQSYDEDWGVPLILPVIAEIMQDANVNKGVAYLVNEASVGVQKIEDFADAVSGGPDAEMTLQDRMEAMTLARSIYRTVFMDKEESFERVSVAFAGLPEIIDRNAKRLAAAANIPATRFWGQSPVGMNATGESDMANYAISIAAAQKKQLTKSLDLLDSILSKHAGITEKVKYNFPSLIDISDSDQADVFLKKAQAIAPLVLQGIITEEEGREALDGDSVLGNLEVEIELPEVAEFKRRALEANQTS